MAGLTVVRHRAPQLPTLPWISYLRVPAMLSGLLLLVWFPLILRLRTLPRPADPPERRPAPSPAAGSGHPHAAA